MSQEGDISQEERRPRQDLPAPSLGTYLLFPYWTDIYRVSAHNEGVDLQVEYTFSTSAVTVDWRITPTYGLCHFQLTYCTNKPNHVEFVYMEDSKGECLNGEMATIGVQSGKLFFDVLNFAFLMHLFSQFPRRWCISVSDIQGKLSDSWHDIDIRHNDWRRRPLSQLNSRSLESVTIESQLPFLLGNDPFISVNTFNPPTVLYSQGQFRRNPAMLQILKAKRSIALFVIGTRILNRTSLHSSLCPIRNLL